MTDSATAAPVAPGDILGGKYRVERVLGAGGMGVVVAATHLQLEQTVALKFVLPSAMAIPGVVERFVREARAAVKLKGEHVGKVLDVGTLESGAPFMVMEYLEGSDLGALLEQGGPLPIDTAVDFVTQACRAIAEAHTLGIVHRDLKPQNLFVARRANGTPVVKVLDFGISKITNDLDGGLTSTQAVIGSPFYMSPEQMRSSKQANAQSDVWSLGVILFECLTGKMPFSGESMPELVVSVMQSTPPEISKLRPDAPAALTNIVSKCLNKTASERYAHAGELEAALDSFAQSRRGPPGANATTHVTFASDSIVPGLPSRRARVGFAVLASVVALSSIIVLYKFRQTPVATSAASPSSAPDTRASSPTTEPSAPPAIPDAAATPAPATPVTEPAPATSSSTPAVSEPKRKPAKAPTPIRPPPPREPAPQRDEIPSNRR